MIVVPRWFSLTLTSVSAAYAAAFCLISVAGGRPPMTNLLALGFFIVGMVLCVMRTGRAPLPTTIAATGCGVVLPLLGSVGLDPVRDSYSSGAWYVVGVACIAVVLVWRRRATAACILVGALVLHTYVWGGLLALATFGVLGGALVIAVLVAGGWALSRTEHHLTAFSAAEREALEWQAAQDAYQAERQVRLATTFRLAAGMLERIASATDGLTPADRLECRVLEQSIRDEIRGRRLLNDDVRDQVIAHRRRGALVQVNDDGGIDDIDDDALTAMLATVVAAIADLHSDRIIIRTAPRDSDKAITVVAMSSDPLAAALGVDDGDEQVDLWLELDRPVRV